MLMRRTAHGSASRPLLARAPLESPRTGSLARTAARAGQRDPPAPALPPLRSAWRGTPRPDLRRAACPGRWRRRPPPASSPGPDHAPPPGSVSVCSLVSRSRIGSATRPVSAAPSSSSTLERCRSKPHSRGDARGEEAEPAGHQRGVAAPCAHRRHQFARPRRQMHALPGAFQRIDRQAAQHRHALAQRGLEVQLAVHRARGDGGDTLLQAGEIGEFVERLAGDDRAVHVGDQQPLAAVFRRRGDGVDWRAIQGCADHCHVRLGGKWDISCLAGGQRDRLAAPNRITYPRDHSSAQRGRLPINDQGQHVAHHPAPFGRWANAAQASRWQRPVPPCLRENQPSAEDGRTVALDAFRANIQPGAGISECRRFTRTQNIPCRMAWR